MNRNIGKLIQMNDSAFYVFDIKELKNRIAYLKSKLPDVSLCYAVKANPMITGEIMDDLPRFEICSPGEARICQRLGVDTEKMVISGVYKTPAFIEETAADPDFKGIFTVESMRQYDLLCALSEKYGRTLQVLLRLTNGSQFGINASDIEEIIAKREDNPGIVLKGIQFFSGTQKTSLKKFARELSHLDQFLIHLKEALGYEAEELEYGTGFPVSYFKDEELDEDALLDGFTGILREMTSHPKITLELGRSIAASCGRYYTHVVDMKQNKGQNYLLTDGGMHHIVYFGQHMAMKHPFLSVVGKETPENGTSWTICGSLCSMNDIIVKQAVLPDIEVGDVICFEKTGAYCMTEGIALFLTRDLPALYIQREDESVYCIRSTFETEELNMPEYERI